MNTFSAASLPDSVDILIIGYGPVGAALAALLGRYGAQVLVIDKESDILLMPRAIALDNEALRILQMVGLTDTSFARIGIQEVKMHCPLVGEFGRINTAGVIDGHPKLVTFYQPELERALREKVQSFDNVAVRCGWALSDLQQTGNGVTAFLQHANGEHTQVRAQYLVGADGASSKVRHLIKQDFDGETYTQDWLIVDAVKRGQQAIDHVEFLCDPQRPTPHMPAPGGRERWEFMLQPGETKEEMERPEKIKALLKPWADADDLVIERHAVYRFHARCCRQFQKDRVFLVGDAAHVTPPFVGQGLVAGLRDAANLAWKLAWVTRGQASPALLKSYNDERQPHARKMIGLAKFMGYLVMPENQAKAALIHGAVRALRWVPTLREYMDELKIKPGSAFNRGFFAAGKSCHRLRRGGPLFQSLVKQNDQIHLSDDVLGDQLMLVGFGLDPQTLLESSARERWLAAGGRFLHIGMRGQPPQSDTPFVEALGNDFVLGKPQGWLAVIRPDRVIMHDGAPEQANVLVSQCLAMLR
jgi:3-(3-hydroxy-phenyl)propionate hydroxylase